MKQRQSNIELLRILAIFCVLMGHGCWLGADLPTAASMSSNPLPDFMRILLGSATIGSVDVFVLISGWFGIHPTRRGLGKFVYQVFFLLWFIYIVALVTGNASITMNSIKATMGIYDGYWFVMAYLGMYILSPVLNAFAETASKRQFSLLLIAFYAFQCYYCWGWGMVNYFNGYSIVFFCCLYLTARYVRLYHVKILQNHPWTVYLASTFIIMIVATFGLWYFGSPVRMWRYDNPLVIVGSVCIIVAFNKMNFSSKAINWLAKSSFAVYIVHFNPFVFPYFQRGAAWLSDNYNGLLYILLAFSYFAIVYIACSVVDWIRMVSWAGIQRKWFSTN